MPEGERPSPQSAIEHCDLFGFLSAEDRAGLSARCVRRRYPVGEILAREGDAGDEMFVLVDGIIEVYTDTPGEDVILARLDRPGAHVGEQALAQDDGLRTASLRAASEVELLVIDRDTFTDAMRRNPALAEQVEAIGERQARQLSLVERSVMYRALATFDQADGWSRDESYADGEIVFREGDPGETVYVIRSGDARVSRLDGARERVLAVLHPGQTFGELAVMAGDRRQATVTAVGDLHVVAFDRERFLEATGQSPELHDYLGTLKRIYALGDGLATQFDGEFRGEPAVVTLIRLDGDHEAVIHHARDLYSGSIQLSESEGLSEHRFVDERRNILRTLMIREGRLFNVHVEGPWAELDRVHAALIEGRTVSPSALEAFERDGHLFERIPDQDLSSPEAILCNCLKVRRKALEQCIARGAETVDDIAGQTGASSVCGGCAGRLAEMLGSAGQPVQLVETIEAGRNVRSYRFQPAAGDEATSDPLRTALPGQHVIISADIDGHWVHRPYTITSAADCTDYREITVKREPHGYLSNHLFSTNDPPPLRLSHPKGRVWVDLDRPDPVICLVAGIGMTPALAIARSVARSEGEVPLHIDYSARTEADLVYREELDQLASACPNISVRYRITGRGERLSGDDLAQLHGDHPHARYFVCGPEPYQAEVAQRLKGLGVAANDLHVEVFTPVGHAPEGGETRSTADRIAAWSLVAMAGLFLVGDRIGLRVEALAQAQEGLGWSTVTGLLLVAAMAYHWMLPLRRIQGRLQSAARHYRWHRHLGLLAPPLLYLHSVSLGYALTAVLAGCWLANAVLGAFDKTSIRDGPGRERYQKVWLIAHVVLSCLLVVLTSWHIWVAYVYK